MVQSKQVIRPSILCVTRLRAFMPVYIENTTNSSDSSKTGAPVGQLSSYLIKSVFKAILTNISRGEGGISPILLLFSFTDVSSKEGGVLPFR